MNSMLARYLVVFYPVLTLSLNNIHFETQTSLSATTVCLKQVIDLFVTNSSVVFFSEEIRQLPWTDSLLKVMQKPKFVFEKQYGGAISGFYVLFPELSVTYLQFFSDKIHSRSKFLLVWLNNTNLEAISSIFDDFWFHQYINVVAMVKAESNNSSSFNFYTFDPYSVGKCGAVSKPYIISEWNWKTEQFSGQKAWFPRKLRNLAGCPLIAIGIHQPPDNIMHYNGTWRAKGVGNKILRIAEQYVNFSSIIIGVQMNVSLDHSWYYYELEMTNIFKSVEEKKADFAFGWYSYANMEIKNFDWTFELGRVSSIDCFGWAVPYRAGSKPPNITYYVNEFNFVTWGLIFLVLSLCSVLFHMTSRRDLVTSSLEAMQTFLERPTLGTHAHEDTASFKIMFISFCFYGLVISTAYKASFSSFLSVPNQGREFKNVKDILNSSLHIRGSPTMKKIINQSAGYTSMGKALLERFEIQEPCDYKQILTRLVRERDIALLGVKRKMYYYSIHEAKRIKVKIPFRFIPGCLVRPHTTHFLFKRGSHLIEPLNVVLDRLFESGITTYWILHLGTNRVLPLERFKGRTLKLFFLKEPLSLLLVGYVSASLVFLCEILAHKKYTRKCIRPTFDTTKYK